MSSTREAATLEPGRTPSVLEGAQSSRDTGDSSTAARSCSLMLTLTRSEVMVAPRKRRPQEEVVQTPQVVLKEASEALHLITSALPLDAEAGGVVGALQAA